jgi:hypothetical protein
MRPLKFGSDVPLQRCATCSYQACALVVAIAWTILDQGATAAVDFSTPPPAPLAGPGVGDRIIAGDVNGDCAPDLLATRDFTQASNDPSLVLLVGNGLGGFPDSHGLGGGATISDIALVDINGDGILDLISAENFERQPAPFGLCQSQDPKVPVFRGDGTGSFVHLGCLTARDHPGAVVAGDFDEDGRIDLLVANAPSAGGATYSSEAILFLGVGDGTFLPGEVVFNQRADDMAVADINRDGHLDLAVAGRSSTYVFWGAGDGTFTSAGSGITGSARRVAIGDVNADGAPDIAAVGSNANNTSDDVVWVALNDGAGNFSSVVSSAAGSHPVDVAIADLDRDGFGDVIVANNLSDDVWVFLAQPGGSLAPAQTFPAGSDPTAVALTDVNKDGYSDIAVANRNVQPDGSLADGSVSRLIQRITAPLGIVTSALPPGQVGTAYRLCLAARGGTPPYSWGLVAGALPTGLVLDSAAGGIRGTPTQTETTNLTLEARDDTGNAASRAYSLATGVGLTYTYHRDADADGFGNPVVSIDSTNPIPPHGYVLDATDCDDGNPSVNPGASDTSCDGVDQNCNLTIDEGFMSAPTACGVGTCASTGSTSCVAGSLVDSCTPGTPGTEACNGLDDDCDGATDEELGSTTCGIGACQVTVDNCLNGAPQTCTPGAPGTETCNGLDDDCDGAIDNGFDVGTACSVGVGACAANGTKVCTADGSGTECGATPGTPGTETCNGLDDDCDGRTDEGYVGDESCFVPGNCNRVSICLNGGETLCQTTEASDVTLSMPDDAGGAPMSMVMVPISVDPADHLTSFQIELRFDPSVVSATDVDLTPATADFSLEFNTPPETPGRLLISIYRADSGTMIGTGPQAIAMVTFRVGVDAGDATPIHFVTGITDDGVSTCLDDGRFTVCRDRDDDGFTECEGDCDDTNSEVNPGAFETCDAVDHNCDGRLDDAGANNSCSDSNVCNGREVCSPNGSCDGGTAPDCRDDNDCTLDSCDQEFGCQHLEADPGTPCGDPTETACDQPDTCDDNTFCQPNHVWNKTPCTDDNECNTADQCMNGACMGGPPQECDDSNACTRDSCNSSTGCVYEPSCSLSGHILYYRNHNPPVEPSTKPVGGEIVDYASDLAPTMQSNTTDVTGLFMFDAAAGNVSLTPRNRLVTEAECDAAITAFDAAEIATYTVGRVDLTPNQRIAAEVSNNGSITAFDAALVAIKAVARNCAGFAFPVETASGSNWAWAPPALNYPLVGPVNDAEFLGILYGDVTGNWGLPIVFAAARGQASEVAPPESSAPTATMEMAVASRATEAVLYVSRGMRMTATRQWEVLLGLQNADGILGLDLTLSYDPDVVAIRNVKETGVAAPLQLVSNQEDDTLRITLYGATPLQGSGDFLVVTFEAKAPFNGVPFVVSASANEGRIPISVAPGGPWQGPLPIGGRVLVD